MAVMKSRKRYIWIFLFLGIAGGIGMGLYGVDSSTSNAISLGIGGAFWGAVLWWLWARERKSSPPS